MTEKGKVITIKDIAKECGVSVTTVSRVLSNSEYPVRLELRDRIVKVAERLNYTPNLFARGLKTNESNDIAVLIPSITNSFYTSLISGIEGVVTKEGYNLQMYNTNNSYLSEEKILTSILGKRISGMIISTGYDSVLFIKELHSKKMPPVKIVLVDYAIPNSSYSSIYFDYKKGSMMGVEYLINKGHRNIVYAGLRPDSRTRIDRIEGFKDAVMRAGIQVKEDMICIFDGDIDKKENFEFFAGVELAKRILAMSPRPTSVVAVNDMVAFGLINYFNKKAIRVPQEISVIGFDDSLFCEVCYPSLTTIRVPSKQMGEMAARLLVGEMKGESTNLNLTIESLLVERQSVAEMN